MVDEYLRSGSVEFRVIEILHVSGDTLLRVVLLLVVFFFFFIFYFFKNKRFIELMGLLFEYYIWEQWVIRFDFL